MSRPWAKYYSEAAKAFDAAPPRGRTIAQAARDAVAAHGPKPALTTSLPSGAEVTITYDVMGERSDHFAAWLREEIGLGPGNVVALMSPNCIGFCVASIGIAKAGCIGTNVNPLYTASELEHQLTDSRADAIVIMDLFLPTLEQVLDRTGVRTVVVLTMGDFFEGAPPPDAGRHVAFVHALEQGRSLAERVDVAAYTAGQDAADVALYQYTSGTTGRSKGAELTHDGILLNAETAHLMSASRSDGIEITAVIALPLYHITAFALNFIAGILRGGHGILIPSPRPPANLRHAFETREVNWFTGINTLFAGLLAEDWVGRDTFGTLRYCGSGGAAQTTGVARKWQEATGVVITQGYGMTEVCGVLTLNPVEDSRFGKVGIPCPGVELRIVDDAGQDVPLGTPGEVIARTPTMMKGYLRRPDATAEAIRDGWYHSGDIGVMDADGFLEIVDRKKDMILVSGFNVSPGEIEDVISTLPGVVQVGVIGVPDEKMGEAPAAFVVRRDESLTEAEVLARCAEHLTGYKTPRHVHFVDEVPVTLSGKVLRRELRARHVP